MSRREWIEENLRIQTEAGTVIPLSLTSAQVRIYEAWDVAKGQNDGLLRLIILKCRRIRASTAIAARSYEEGMRGSKSGQALTLCSDAEVRTTLDAMLRRFSSLWRGCPAPAYSRRGYELVFPPPVDYRFTAEVADAYAGTSYTVHFLHATEVAKWTLASETAGSLALATRMADQVWESTANGQVGHGQFFFELWQRAQSGDSGWYPLFIPWFEHDEYTIPETDSRFARVMDASLETEERGLQTAYGLTYGQIAWRRWTILEEFGGDVDWFRQELPSDQDEAFLRVEGRRVFAGEGVPMSKCRTHRLWAEQHNMEQPPRVGRLEWEVPPRLDMHGTCENRGQLKVRFVEDGGGCLRVWWPPQHVIRGTPLPDAGVATQEQLERGWSTSEMSIEHHYMGTSDAAKGVQGGDKNSAVILDRYYRRVVAEWHELCAPAFWGEYMAMLALWYQAEIAVEIPGQGEEVITKMLQLIGGNCVWAYHKLVPGRQVSELEYGRWGWRAGDRRQRVSALQEVIITDGWRDPSVEAWAEIMAITYNPTGFPELTGRDRTAARCILADVDRRAPVAAGRESHLVVGRDYAPVDDEPKMDWRTAGLPQNYKGDWRTAGLPKG
uniref:Putative terminase n=1 Tax=viral metagenome TaxID=1070528 RepID=A0A6M3LHX2_9ZZZZ